MGPRRSGLFAVLITLVIADVVGGFAYSAGLAAGQTAVVAPGAVPGTVVYPGGWHPFGFGFGIFGLLFVVLFVGLIVRAFGGGGRGGPGGRGPWGWDRERWQSGEVPPPIQSMLESWHRTAHGDPPSRPDAPRT